ncbi:uncharacterized protein LOC119091547 [Pollicipes pollicipes]|uniref:uncharacterized protein LOC119091547 n=1 Tax=Pollicipes pollicipes TaxID=41117 RepID=UPI001884CCD7|nr:uncharacterized protein LOC119091547 [Pollicipes pollicipes]
MEERLLTKKKSLKAQYIRVVAQMQGYDVAGCRSVLRDGVVPFPKPESEADSAIYETLSEFRDLTYGHLEVEVRSDHGYGLVPVAASGSCGIVRLVGSSGGSPQKLSPNSETSTPDERPASEIENKLSPTFVAQLHDMLQRKTNGPKPEPESGKANVSSQLAEKKRGKNFDNSAFQMARKAVAQALQKGRTQEPQEVSKPKLVPSLSVPSNKPDVTLPVERVAGVPGVIPPPPPLPGQVTSATSKPAAPLLKISPPKALQSDLKKKLEAKKSSIQAEKNEPKKKRTAPRPPDRSFSLPGFGNSRLDIAKAFEEFKRNEANKKQEALLKKKKSKYVDKLDLKDYKNLKSNSVEEEMLTIAAESVDAVKSDLEQRLPMKSFLSEDSSPACQAEASCDTGAANDTDAVPTRPTLPDAEPTVDRSSDLSDDDEPAPEVPARSTSIAGEDRSAPHVTPTTSRSRRWTRNGIERHSEPSFECVLEERAEPLPPKPKPLTKKPLVLRSAVQRAAVVPDEQTEQLAAPRPRPVACKVTVGGSQVIQIATDGSWAVGERGGRGRAVTVTEVERQFEELERAEAGEVEPDYRRGDEPHQADSTGQPTTSCPDPPSPPPPASVDVDDAGTTIAVASVESLSIIANKNKTKHFLEARLQEGLRDLEPITTSTSTSTGASGQCSIGVTTGTSTEPAKMAAQEAISPPPGFDDSPATEGVEFEEFDMDWAPRRPAAPPVRSYMFGEALGARAPPPPASPSYRDLFSADEAASSGSAASLDEARQDSACGTGSLRRREEELRQLREKTLGVHEEPLSGYGSEERESFTEEPPG